MIIDKIGTFFRVLVYDKGIMKFIMFTVMTLAIFAISYLVTDSSIIVGAVDMPEEWEYIRMLATISIITSLLVIFVFNWRQYVKRKV